MREDNLREEIIRLVGDYVRRVHSPQPFIPGETVVHYGGRVYDER